MVFLEGDPPPAPMLMVLVIRPDGSVSHVSAEVAPDDWNLPYADFSERLLRPAIAYLKPHVEKAPV